MGFCGHKIRNLLSFLTAKVYAKNAMFFCSQSRKVFSHYCHPERSRRAQSTSTKIGSNLKNETLRLCDFARDV